MNAYRFSSLLGLLVWSSSLLAQTTTYTYQTFKDTRLVNGHTVEMLPEGELKAIIAHRFGALNDAYNLFGLDQAAMRMGVDYGVIHNLNIGIGRTTLDKTWDAYAKYKLLSQSSGAQTMPLTATILLSGATITTKRDSIFNSFERRTAYTAQVLLARKFSDRFSLQVMPTLLHRNLVETSSEKNDVFAIGFAPKLQLTRTVGISAEYYYALPNQLATTRQNSLSIGVEIETKGHAFQLFVTNSKGMNERYYVGETTGNWQTGEVFFGFNLTRTFRLTGRKLD